MEEQHLTPNRLVYMNVEEILMNVINKLEIQDLQ